MTTGCTLGFIPLILSSVEGQCEIVELPDGECLCVDICQGSVGGTGPQGPQGFDGAQGIQGTQGSQGYDGPPGPQGPTGYQGLPGIKGATGTPLGIILEFDDAVAGGVSGSLISFNSVDSTGVSEVWVDNFSKAGQDLTNWINSWYTGWPGPTGYGPYGVLTVQSTLNSDALFNFNITGITYVNAGGLTYFKLACDALYYPGAEIVNFLTDGDDVAITFSKDGPPGPQGFDGAQGIQGTQGSQGHRGDPGFQGAQGIQGHQGYQGYDGDVGPQGPTGFDGAEGIKGSTGIPLGTIMDYVESATGGTADGKLSFNNIDSADISEVWLDDESKYNQPLRDWIDSWYSGFPGATGYGPYGVLNVHSTEAADVLFSFKITDIFDRTTYYRLGCEPLSYPGNTVTDFLTNDDDVAITFSRYGPPGPQGFQGFDGAQGIQGHQGPGGPKGFQGYDGPIGTIGPTGPEGPEGPQGPIGYAGAVGPIGPQGYDGTEGPDGPPGPQGVTGPQGHQGYQGTQGSQGSQGEQGFQGYQGYQGNQGIQGHEGPIGPDGIRGFQGAQGIMGHDGAEGPEGPEGPQGPIGYAGAVGPIGPQGYDGTEGPDGPPGPQGVTGPQGHQGHQGYQGTQGSQGEQGSQGFQGYQGNQGIQGERGFPLGIIMDFDGATGGGVASGKLSFDEVRADDISEVWLDDESKAGQSLILWINSWYTGFPGATGSNYGVLNVRSTKAADTVFSFNITGITFVNALTTYYKLECNALYFPGEVVADFLSDGDDAAISFTRYGPPGSQGFQGFQGFDGAQGIQGHQGPGGPKGFQGYDGPIGTIGPTGPEGPEGPQGPIGYAGAVGPIGPQGYDGTEGPDGPPGPQGVTGPQGHQGYQGTQGSQGSQGEQGFQGYQGYQGIQGHEGEKGSPLGIIMTFDEAVNGGTADGKLSFNDEHTTPISEVWIDSHSKSLQPLTTWIQSWYSGYPGATGQGPYGVLSVQSTVTSNTLYTFKVTGINALTSYYVIDCDPVYFPGEVVADFLSDGDDVAISFTRYGPPGGPQGAQGSQGQGAQGAQGTDGPQGAQGFQGAQGQGAQGAQGTDGPPGPAGATGLTALAIEARDALWARNTTTGGMISETGCYPFLGSLNNPNSGGGGTGTDEDGNADGYGLSFFEGVTWSYGGDGGEAGTGAWKPTPPIFSRWNDTTAIMNAAWREMSWEDGEMGASLITTLESDVTIKATGLGSIQADQISLASGGYTAVANVPLSEWSASDLDITGKYLTTTNLLVKADSLTVGDACPVPLPFCYMALSAADVASSDEKALGYSNVPTTIESNISDFVWDDTAKNWIVKIAGTYRVIGAVILEGGSSLVNLNVNLEGVSILTGAPRVHSSVDPLEHTIMAVFTAAADDVVNITYEATAASTVKAIIGSTFFMERLK